MSGPALVPAVKSGVPLYPGSRSYAADRADPEVFLKSFMALGTRPCRPHASYGFEERCFAELAAPKRVPRRAGLGASILDSTLRLSAISSSV